MRVTYLSKLMHAITEWTKKKCPLKEDLENFLKKNNGRIIKKKLNTYILVCHGNKPILLVYKMPFKGIRPQDENALLEAISMPYERTKVPYLQFRYNETSRLLTVRQIGVPSNINGKDFRRKGIGFEMLRMLVERYDASSINIESPGPESIPWWNNKVTPLMKKKVEVVPIPEKEVMETMELCGIM